MEKLTFIKSNAEVPAIKPMVEWSVGEAPPVGNGPSFGNVLSSIIDRTDNALHESDKAVVDFVQGKMRSPHELMIKMEEAHLTLQWTLQIRNKVLDAYNEVMRMQL